MRRLFVLALLGLCEAQDCFLNGVCGGNYFLVSTNANTPSANDCLQRCKDSTGGAPCNFFSYEPNNQGGMCVLTNDCPVRGSTADCDGGNCVYGEATCSPLNVCNEVGLCQGVMEEVSTQSTLAACSTVCDNNANCLYYTYNSQDDKCFIFSSDCSESLNTGCPQCGNCVTNQKGCATAR